MSRLRRTRLSSTWLQPTVSTMAGLFNTTPQAASYVLLRGPEFRLQAAINAIGALRDASRPAGHYRALGEALRSQLPPALLSMPPAAIVAEPTPFLPFILEVEGWLLEPGYVDQSAFERMGGYVNALLHEAHHSGQVLVVAATLLGQCVDVCLRVAAVGTARAILDALVSRMKAHAAASVPYICALPDVLEAKYQVTCAEWDQTETTNVSVRRRRTNAALVLIGDIASAVRVRNRVLRGRPASADMAAERFRLATVGHHRRLLWSEAMARETGPVSGARTAEWRAIARRYLQLNDAPNAMGALANGLDAGLEAFNRGLLPAPEIRNELVILATALERRCLTNTLSIRARETLVPSLRTLVLFFLRVNYLAKANAYICLAMSFVAQRAEGDAFRRSYLLRDADDWLGIAARADLKHGRLPGYAVDLVHRVLRGRVWGGTTAMPAEASVLALVSRQGGVIEVRLPAGTERWLTADSHQLGVALDAAVERGWYEIEVSPTATPKDPPLPWTDICQRIIDNFRLDKLRKAFTRNGSVGERRTLVETEGNGMHVPWLAVLQHAGVPVESVLIHNAARANLRRFLASVHPPLVLDCFAKSDVHQAELMRSMARALQVQRTAIATPTQLRNALQTPSRLVVLGCHGSLARPNSILSLELGGVRTSIVELLGGLDMAQWSPVIVAFVCFGAGGISEAGGDWVSLPERFLTSGAIAVVASATPAWTGPYNVHLVRLVENTWTATQSQDLWAIGASVAKHTARLRELGADAKDWVGWGTWI